MANSKRRAILQTVPFHEAIIEEMMSISPNRKDGRARFVQCARLIRRTKCPKNRHSIRNMLKEHFKDFSVCVSPSRRLSTSDISEFLGALEALDIQDAEEMQKQAEHSKPVDGDMIGVTG
jgi:hypothetical protein